jgi:hypothetical protein
MREPISLGKSLTTAKKSTAFLYNEEFDESVADYLILVGAVHITQIRFCQLFSVTILQFFPQMSHRAAYENLAIEYKIDIVCNIMEVF